MTKPDILDKLTERRTKMGVNDINLRKSVA